jgi:hypothetical protein
MKFFGASYKNSQKISYKLLTNFLSSSYVLLAKILQTYNELITEDLTNF